MPIVTFYSYKGGTGRSMALANVAWILASNGYRVLVVDWDLEAPGLHRYFRPFLIDKELTGPDSQGVIDFVVDFSVQMATPATEKLDANWYHDYADISKWSKRLLWPSGEIATMAVKGCIDFVPAGQQGPQYGKKVNSFDWANFYEQMKGGAFFDAVRQSMTSYDWVLIDSRTGVSDTAGICTLQLPDILVVCFTLNYQSINGAFSVASGVKKNRPEIDIWPVPTRIDGSEEKLLKRMKDYAAKKFTPLLNRYVDPDRYWFLMEVPYFARYAYSEKLAPFEDQTGISTSTLPAMERLTDRITDGQVKRLLALPEEDRKETLAEFEASPDALHTTAGEYVRGGFTERLVRVLLSFLVTQKGALRRLILITFAVLIGSLSGNMLEHLLIQKDPIQVVLDGAQKDLQSGRAGAHDHAALLLAEAAKRRQDKKGTSALDPNDKTDSRLLNLFYSLGPLRSGFTRHNAPVRVVRFSPDGALVATASDDKTTHVFRNDGNPKEWLVTSSAGAIDFSPDGKYMAVGMQDGTRIFDAQSQRYLLGASSSRPVQRLAFSPDSQSLLVLGNQLVLYNLVPFKQAAAFTKYLNVTSLAFSSDSTYFAAGTAEGDAVAYSTKPPGKYSRTYSGPSVIGLARMVAFAPGGRYWLVALASADGYVILWDQGGAGIAQLLVGADVYAIAFSPDGKLLATGSLDGTARLWSVPEGKQLAAAKYLADVRALDFSSDGKWLATGSGDGTARILEVATFKEIQKISYNAEVNSVAFSRDRKYLAVGSSDGTAGTWVVQSNGSQLPSLAPAQMISLACKQVTGTVFISQVEWEQYFGKEAYHPICTSQNAPGISGGNFNGGGGGSNF